MPGDDGDAAFGSPVQVRVEELHYEPFRNRRQAAQFTSREPALDDCIRTDEAEVFQAQSLGYTTLVYWRGELAAYYTVSMDGLRYDRLKKRKRLNESNYLEIEVYPALKIGRLAVDHRFQGRGIGRRVMDRIVTDALRQQVACRLIILNAKEGAITFYEKYGFVRSEHRQDRSRRERLMFFDLEYVRGLA
jgi:GNAT superfamily N-acetyltransferase